MKPVRLGTVVALAALVGGCGWVVLDAWDAGGGLPVPVPWTAPACLFALAVVVLVAAREVRRWVTGRRERPLEALTAARIAVLTRTACYTGGILTGFYAALALAILPDVVGDRRTRMLLAILATVAAVTLAVAGLISQRWCRRPTDGDLDAKGHAEGQE